MRQEEEKQKEDETASLLRNYRQTIAAFGRVFSLTKVSRPIGTHKEPSTGSDLLHAKLAKIPLDLNIIFETFSEILFDPTQLIVAVCIPFSF